MKWPTFPSTTSSIPFDSPASTSINDQIIMFDTYHCSSNNNVAFPFLACNYYISLSFKFHFLCSTRIHNKNYLIFIHGFFIPSIPKSPILSSILFFLYFSRKLLTSHLIISITKPFLSMKMALKKCFFWES